MERAWRFDAKPSFLRSDEAECRPIETRIATRDSGAQTVPHDLNGWHGHARAFCFGKGQANILQRKRHNESGRVGLTNDLVAVNSVDAPAEHRVCQDLQEGLGIESQLEKQSHDLSEHLQRCCRHHVAEQLDEIGDFGIGTDHKGPLSEAVEERVAARDIVRSPSGDDIELTRPRGIRISEHRRCDVAWPRRACSIAT